MHRIGRKIELARPSKRAPLQEDLAEKGRIAERFEDASIRRMDEGLQIDVTFKAIVEGVRVATEQNY